MNTGKNMTRDEMGKAVMHWRRRLSGEEAKAAAEGVKRAVEAAGFEAELFGPSVLRSSEAGRRLAGTYRYSPGKCPTRGRSSFSLGWETPWVVVKIKNAKKKVRTGLGDEIAGFDEIWVNVEKVAGFRSYGRFVELGDDRPNGPKNAERLLKKNRGGLKKTVEDIDADPLWECEGWHATIRLNGTEREYRRRTKTGFQTAYPFVYAPTEQEVIGLVAEQIDWVAKTVRIGKYSQKKGARR